LPRDDGARLPRRFRIDPRMVEEVARVGDRAERVAQLVAEHRQELVLGAARRFGRGARLALAPQELFALGFVLRPLAAAAASALPPRGSPDRRRRRHHGLAPAERLRGGAQPGHRRGDAAGDGKRREHAERDRE
jgi:hypothetical protein